MPNVAGFIRVQLDQIELWQFEGLSLQDIHTRLCPIYQQPLTFNAFIVSLYRARKQRRIKQPDTAMAATKEVVSPIVTTTATQQRQGQKNMIKQIRQIFKDGADVSDFLP